MVSARAGELFCEMFVHREKSALHQQHQNGVPERGIRTVKESVRTTMSDTKVPMHLWGHCAKHSVEVGAHVESNALPPGETENTLFYGKENDDTPSGGVPFAMLKPFGCKATIHRGKALVKDGAFGERAIEGIYIGVEIYELGKCVLVYSHGRIYRGTDVEFDTEYFPYRDDPRMIDDTQSEARDPFQQSFELGASLQQKADTLPPSHGTDNPATQRSRNSVEPTVPALQSPPRTRSRTKAL